MDPRVLGELTAEQRSSAEDVLERALRFTKMLTLTTNRWPAMLDRSGWPVREPSRAASSLSAELALGPSWRAELALGPSWRVEL